MANDKKKVTIEIEGDAESLKKAIDDSASYLDKITNKVETVKTTLVESTKTAVAFGQAFGAAIKANLDLTLEFASRIAGVKGGLLGLLTLQNASYGDLFGKFLVHLGALGLQVNEAKKFESAFADAKKVISGTDEELAKVEQTIKRLASKEIPIDLTGLTEIAASGGQLGIATDQLEEYIQTTAQAGVAFEMLPKEAGTAIGGLTNIFNEPIKNIRFLLDQINVLGDSTAATERDILDVMRFVGGEGKRFGLMKGEIAALIATMLSMQKPPEVVRTALNGLFSALTTGEMRSEKFNETLGRMGLSAEQLARDIQANPQATLVKFLETIVKFDKIGQSNILSGLFGQGTDAGSIGDLSGALDVLKANFDKVQDAAGASGSMLRTFENRAGTLENKAQLAANAVGVLAVEVGNPFLAPLKMATDAFHHFTDSMAQFAAENPAVTAFLRIIALVKSLSLLLGSLSVVSTAVPLLYTRLLALPAVASAVTFLATSGMGAFAGQIVIAGIAISLLTGAVGGFNSLMLSLVATVGLVGYNSVIAFRAAGASATVLNAVLAGLRTSFVALLGAFGGGWIAVLLVGLSMLFVAFANLKDKVFQLSGVSINLTEVLGAAWSIVARKVGEAIAFIGGYLNQFGAWLSGLVGINQESWQAIVSYFEQSTLTIGSLAKGLGNIIAGALDFIASYAGIRMAQFVETIRIRMAGAVSIARAAARDIAAAMSGNFSGANTREAVAVTGAKVDNASSLASASIKEAGARAVSKDYVGELLKATSDAIANEIKANRKAPSVSAPPELRASGGGMALPDVGDGAGGKGGGKSGKAKNGSSSAAAPVESEMHGFEAALEAKKIAFEKSHALQEFSKQDEKAYWDAVIANYKGNAKTLADLKKKSADLELEIIREEAKKKQDLLKEQQQAEANAAQDAINTKLEAAQQQAAMGEITQGKLLQLEREYARESAQIAINLARQKRDLTQKGTVERAQAEEAILQAIRNGANQERGIANRQALERKAQFNQLFAPLENALDQSVNGILTGQQTLGNALRNMAQSVTISYIQESLKRRLVLAKDWLWETAGFTAKESANVGVKATAETLKAGAVVAGETAQTAAVTAGESARGGITLLTTLKAIGAKAAQAAAGAFSWVMTEVPFPFNAILAPIAAAGAFMGTMAFGSMASSKDGLWEVPEDRLQFVHKKETILPAKIAEPMRRMFDGGFLGRDLSPEAAELLKTIQLPKLPPAPPSIMEFVANQRAAVDAIRIKTEQREQMMAEQLRIQRELAAKNRRTRDEVRVTSVDINDFFKGRAGDAVVKTLKNRHRNFQK